MILKCLIISSLKYIEIPFIDNKKIAEDLEKIINEYKINTLKEFYKKLPEILKDKWHFESKKAEEVKKEVKTKTLPFFLC